jgi:hypothetical protein
MCKTKDKRGWVKKLVSQRTRPRAKPRSHSPEIREGGQTGKKAFCSVAEGILVYLAIYFKPLFDGFIGIKKALAFPSQHHCSKAKY